MAYIQVDKGGSPPPVSTKDGTDYDRCPKDGCIEVDPMYRIGSDVNQRAAGYYADVRKGGCGMNWARTEKQGVARDQARGLNPKWPTRAAGTGRFVLEPTDAYRENYERIFGHK